MKSHRRPELEPLGKAVRLLREQTDFSQERLAHAAELDRTFVGGIERGERNVSFLAITRLLMALETSWEEFGRIVDDVAAELAAEVSKPKVKRRRRGLQ